MHQIKNIIVLVVTILVFITSIFYDQRLSQGSLSLFFPQSKAEKKLAELLHEQITQNNFSEFVKILDHYPELYPIL